jgi:hypothetical protein
MSAVGWAGFVIAAAAAVAVALYVYRRRELPGRGRGVLAALRAAALLILLLVLFDPQLPGRAGGAPGGGTVVLLDGSLSMLLPSTPGAAATRWDEARAEALRRAGGRQVIVFGEAAVPVAAAELRELQPEAPVARLLPALRAAAEAGARQAVVLTDGRIEDAREAATWLPSLGIEVEFRRVGGDAPANRALAELQAPAWAEAGRPVAVSFGVLATGGGGESVTVVVRQGEEVLGSATVPVAPDGRVATGEIAVTPRAPAGGGQVRLDVAIEPGDAIAADDVRSRYVFVTDQPAGVVLVSFSPDWEPRFLQPVLAQVLGLPVRGYLQVDGATPYRASGLGFEAGATATEDEVRRAAGRADLLVLHGYDEGAPGWARELAGRHPRLMVLAGGFGTMPGLPVETGAPVQAEWYPAAELPASPVAPLLAGVETADAPPLTMLRPATPLAGAWASLNATRGVRGAASPAAVAGQSGARRWAVATGQGYWRWSFRGEPYRQLYSRFWGALAGWLMTERPVADGAEVRPDRRVVQRGGSIVWRLPAGELDSVAVRLAEAGGGVVMDTVLTGLAADSALHRAPRPGHYRYEATAFAGGTAAAAGQGELTVESYTPEFARAAVDLGALTGGARPVGARAAGGGRPLHSSPLPYVIIVTLIAVEWVLRRRWGLR